MLLIKNGHIKPITSAELSQGCVLIGDDGKIISIAQHIDAPEGAQVIDAGGRLVTPGCVEAHCHIGLSPEFMQGVLGSANIVGGTFAAIKLAGKRVDDMIIKAPVAMKCAFGENPKNQYGNTQKKAPKTRMAVAAMLRELLFKTQNYLEAKESGKNPTFDMKLEAMIPVIKGELPLKVHAHRADDIFTALRIVKEFNLKMTLDHCTDGMLIADELAKENIPVFVGPGIGKRRKQELEHKSFATAGVLHKAGLKVSIITDALVSPLHFLPLCAGLAAAEGLPMEEAWKAITINPAEALGIADRVGSLEPGKDGDVVIWTADPLTTIGGRAYITIVDGKVVYQA